MNKNINKLLNNCDHVCLIDKWALIAGYAPNNESDMLYLADKVKQYFPEYRECDLYNLADTLKQLVSITI